MNFDLHYTFGNRKQKETIYNTKLDQEKINEIFKKRTVICKSLAILLKRILSEFGVKGEIAKDTNYRHNKHVFNIVYFSDFDTFAKVDLEEDLEFIQTRSKTHFFGITDTYNSFAKQDLIPEEQLKQMDTTTAEYIPWGFYFDSMLRILKLGTKNMPVEEKLKNVLDNLDVYVADRTLGYRERIYYHNRMLSEVFSDKEKRKIHQINCYKMVQQEKHYVSCVVLERPKEENIVYLYSDKKGKYQEISMTELAKEVINGLVLLDGVQGLKRYMDLDSGIPYL